MAADDLHAFLRSRRSVRRFVPQQVPRALLENILETATWAPSAHNRQPWRFIVLTALDHKSRLAEFMGEEFRRDLVSDGVPLEEVKVQLERSRSRLMQAPAAVVLCLDLTMMDHYPDEVRQNAEHLMAVQSVALSGGTLLLAAHAEGLAGVWVCAPLFAPGAVRQALDLPESWEPQGMILLGYPARAPKARPRRLLTEVALFL